MRKFDEGLQEDAPNIDIKFSGSQEQTFAQVYSTITSTQVFCLLPPTKDTHVSLKLFWIQKNWFLATHIDSGIVSVLDFDHCLDVLNDLLYIMPSYITFCYLCQLIIIAYIIHFHAFLYIFFTPRVIKFSLHVLKQQQ